MVKNPPAVQETFVQSIDWEGPLEEGMATHSNILAWRIPQTEEPGGSSPWHHKELDMIEVTEHAHVHTHTHTNIYTHICTHIHTYIHIYTHPSPITTAATPPP